MSEEFLIPLPASIEAPLAMPLDKAIEIACKKLGFPALGGPSGKGWSLYSTAQRCPHLFKRTYIEVPEGSVLGAELRVPAIPLQVGALYHSLHGLYYGHGLGEFYLRDRGIIRADILDRTDRRRGKKQAQLPADAADQLLAELKAMATPLTEDLAASVAAAAEKAEQPEQPKRPSADLIYEGERCFDKHTEYYGSREDLEPLAIEWLAYNADLDYSCRYDAIFRVGKNHCMPEIKPGAIVAYERKTSAWLSEMAKDGWWLDGEILGEILNWKIGGCERLFGPLDSIVVDIVTKAKDQKILQVRIPADLPTVEEHARWIHYTQGQIAMWDATGVYPKHFTQCFDRWGKCGNWDLCRSGDK